MRQSTKAAFILTAILLTSCTSRVLDRIGTPALISPEDGVTIIENPPAFFWHRVADAVAYNLQVADGPFDTPHTLILDVSCHPDTNYVPFTVIETGTYYWRAQALQGG
ncbi:MAG: hypothetical protein JSW49_00405 [candidate division WOR-3 bacterium]|nr:MAG: hypothetical protein JSW49_00405 [candidate division WOR-3 bacterium]